MKNTLTHSRDPSDIMKLLSCAWPGGWKGWCGRIDGWGACTHHHAARPNGVATKTSAEDECQVEDDGKADAKKMASLPLHVALSLDLLDTARREMVGEGIGSGGKPDHRKALIAAQRSYELLPVKVAVRNQTLETPHSFPVGWGGLCALGLVWEGSRGDGVGVGWGCTTTTDESF